MKSSINLCHPNITYYSIPKMEEASKDQPPKMNKTQSNISIKEGSISKKDNNEREDIQIQEREINYAPKDNKKVFLSIKKIEGSNKVKPIKIFKFKI